MQKEIVSVISPCYNVAPYIRRFLDSLLAQSYKNLEIILVNDGSTDSTGEIIKSYIPKLQEEGYSVLYILQENQGQSAAINNALKKVTGKFLTWPDPDDWLHPEAIEKRVKFLEAHPEVGMVRCNAEQINEIDGTSRGLFEDNNKPAFEIENAFFQLIDAKTWFAPMATMIRMDLFDKVVPTREIYVSKKSGQNWQIMLPMAQAYPFWQMPDVLSYYCIRKNSHSHSQKNYKSLLDYSHTSEETLINTLTLIKADNKIISHKAQHYAMSQFGIAKANAPFSIRWFYYKKCLRLSNSMSTKLYITIWMITPYCIINTLNKIKVFNP